MSSTRVVDLRRPFPVSPPRHHLLPMSSRRSSHSLKHQCLKHTHALRHTHTHTHSLFSFSLFPSHSSLLDPLNSTLSLSLISPLKFHFSTTFFLLHHFTHTHTLSHTFTPSTHSHTPHTHTHSHTHTLAPKPHTHSPLPSSGSA